MCKFKRIIPEIQSYNKLNCHCEEVMACRPSNSDFISLITNGWIATPFWARNDMSHGILCEYLNLHYIPDILRCYGRYAKYLQDDYAVDFDIFRSCPNFWIITDYSDKFMGFVFLDNFTGNGNSNFSAEITVCFDKKAWGSFVRYSAKFFLKYCFDTFGFYKIKALIFPDNFRVKTLLKQVGFQYETTLPDETTRGGKLQDIEVYSIKRNYYYKSEVNYD